VARLTCGQFAFANFCKHSGAMAKLSNSLTGGAPKAAAKVSEAAKVSSAKVSERAQNLGDFLRDQRRGAQLTLRQLADQAGVSNPYLSQIERGLRKPSADVLQQLAKALRISAESLYVRAGILEPTDGVEQAVQSAVLADPALSERQRQVLLDIYNAFRRENNINHSARGA
jgi:transcriptional regulator with XRE-family HTH domain